VLPSRLWLSCFVPLQQCGRVELGLVECLHNALATTTDKVPAHILFVPGGPSVELLLSGDCG
jgi:hypothetical protein